MEKLRDEETYLRENGVKARFLITLYCYEDDQLERDDFRLSLEAHLHNQWINSGDLADIEDVPDGQDV